jgi:SH3-like domain-containing protein
MRDYIKLTGLLLALAAPLGAQQVQPRDTLAITTAAATVRAQPAPNAQALGRVTAGAQVRLHTCADGWCRVTTQQLTGYILEEYLNRAAVQAAPTPARGT